MEVHVCVNSYSTTHQTLHHAHTFILISPIVELWIHSPLLWHSVSTMRSVFFSSGSTQSLPCHTASGDNCSSSICPNTVVTYTCTISGAPAGLTDWNLPTGTCPTNTYPDKIRLSQFVSFGQCAAQGSGVPSLCGPFRASSIQPSSGTNCLSSILTVSITVAMNGSTVTCSNTDIMSSATTVVSMATINVVGMLFICAHVVCINGFPDPSIAITLTAGNVQHMYMSIITVLYYWIAGSIISSYVVGIY